MKKIKLSIIIVLLSMVSIASAQNTSYSVKGGLNLSNFYGDELTDKNMKVGFHAGIGADFELAPNISIQSGLFFSGKGAEFTYETSKFEVNANFLQLPLHVAYKIDVTPGTRIVLHAGPYIAYGIGGKTEFNLNGNELTEIDTFKDDSSLELFNGLKPFDAGLGLGIGAEFGNILLDLGWDIGLNDLSRINNVKIRTQNAYLSIGYKF